MNSTAERVHIDYATTTVFGWPHKGHKTPFTESEVQEKVTAIFADELGISHDALTPDMSIKKDFGADLLRLTLPIMTIENFFRTMLQDEVAREEVSVHSIVDKLMGRASRSSDCGANDSCTCTA